jgi:hypothetical protein
MGIPKVLQVEGKGRSFLGSVKGGIDRGVGAWASYARSCGKRRDLSDVLECVCGCGEKHVVCIWEGVDCLRPVSALLFHCTTIIKTGFKSLDRGFHLYVLQRSFLFWMRMREGCSRIYWICWKLVLTLSRDYFNSPIRLSAQVVAESGSYPSMVSTLTSHC